MEHITWNGNLEGLLEFYGYPDLEAQNMQLFVWCKEWSQLIDRPGMMYANCAFSRNYGTHNSVSIIIKPKGAWNKLQLTLQYSLEESLSIQVRKACISVMDDTVSNRPFESTIDEHTGEEITRKGYVLEVLNIILSDFLFQTRNGQHE